MTKSHRHIATKHLCSLNISIQPLPDLCLDGSKVTLETTESTLQCNDTRQVIAEFIRRLNQLGLVTYPRLQHNNQCPSIDSICPTTTIAATTMTTTKNNVQPLTSLVFQSESRLGWEPSRNILALGTAAACHIFTFHHLTNKVSALKAQHLVTHCSGNF